MKIVHIAFLSIFSLGCATTQKGNGNAPKSMDQMFEQTAPKMCHPDIGCFSPVASTEGNVVVEYRRDTKKCEDEAYSNGVVVDGILTTDQLKIEEFKEKYWSILSRKIAYSHETELSHHETEELQAYQVLQKDVKTCLEGIGWSKK